MERSADLGGDEITTAAAREGELVVARFFGAGVVHDHVASFIFEQGCVDRLARENIGKARAVWFLSDVS